MTDQLISKLEKDGVDLVEFKVGIRVYQKRKLPRIQAWLNQKLREKALEENNDTQTERPEDPVIRLDKPERIDTDSSGGVVRPGVDRPGAGEDKSEPETKPDAIGEREERPYEHRSEGSGAHTEINGSKPGMTV